MMLVEKVLTIAFTVKDSPYRVTGWEDEFLTHIIRKAKAGYSLTRKQWTKLREIEARALDKALYLDQPLPSFKFKDSFYQKYKWQKGIPLVDDGKKIPELPKTNFRPSIFSWAGASDEDYENPEEDDPFYGLQEF